MPSAIHAEHLRLRKFLSFAIVGGAATTLHWTLAAVLFTMASVPPVPASSIGFVVSAAFNYLANARYTFGAPRCTASAVRFAVVAGSGLALNGLVLDTGIRIGLPVPAAQCMATVIVLLWNFTLNAVWVFLRPAQPR